MNSILLSTQKNVPESIIDYWNKEFHPAISLFKSRRDIFLLISKIDNMIEKNEEGKKSNDNSYCDRCLTTASSASNINTSFSPLKNSGSKSSSKSMPLSNKLIIHQLLKDNPFLKNNKESMQNLNSAIISIYDTLSERKNIKCKTTVEKSSNLKLISSKFKYEEEWENINIIYNKNRDIKFITIDLMLKKIAKNENWDLFDKAFFITFIEQSVAFLNLEVLIKKSIYAFFFFYSAYEANYQEINFPYSLIDFILLIFEYIKINEIELSSEMHQHSNNFLKQLLSIDEIDEKYKLRIKNITNKFNSYNSSNSFFDFEEDDNINRNYEYCLTSPCIQSNLSISASTFNILRENPNNIAKKLTDITNKLIGKVSPKELIPLSKSKEITSPHVYQLISKANKLNLFIIEEILSYDHKPIRAKVIEKFIAVAESLYMMNNFNDLLTVISAINSFIIQKNIEKSWNLVSTKYKNSFNNLKNFVTFEDSYKNIREMTLKCAENNLSFTPYIGITLKRLAFLEEKSKYLKNNELINIEKILLVEKVINEFMDYKRLIGNNVKILYYCKKEIINHRFEDDKNNLEIFDNLNPKKEKELITLSKLIEPTFTLYPKKKKEKRKTKTDISFYQNTC